MKTTYLETSGQSTSIGGHSVSSFAIRWVHVRQPSKKQTLAALNRQLFRNPQRLLQAAEANTRRLTGQPRL